MDAGRPTGGEDPASVSREERAEAVVLSMCGPAICLPDGSPIQSRGIEGLALGPTCNSLIVVAGTSQALVIM